jgi:hypothetical protein
VVALIKLTTYAVISTSLAVLPGASIAAEKLTCQFVTNFIGDDNLVDTDVSRFMNVGSSVA